MKDERKPVAPIESRAGSGMVFPDIMRDRLWVAHESHCRRRPPQERNTGRPRRSRTGRQYDRLRSPAPSSPNGIPRFCAALNWHPAVARSQVSGVGGRFHAVPAAGYFAAGDTNVGSTPFRCSATPIPCHPALLSAAEPALGFLRIETTTPPRSKRTSSINVFMR